VSADAGGTFGMHMHGTPPLTWLAVVAGLTAMAINQLLLPALNAANRRLMLRDLSHWGAFATNLAAISGGIAVGFGLLSFVRYGSVTSLRQRLLLAGFGGCVFLPMLVMAALLENHTTAQTVLFAFGAAQVLAITVGTIAARAAETSLPRLVACIAVATSLLALLAQVLLVSSQLELPGWRWQTQAQRAVQALGEVCYLLLLTGTAGLLMPKRSDPRSRWARQAGFFVLPVVLGSLYVAERQLGNDYALLLYHAQRVSLFIDAWPRLYSVPIGLALAGCVSALIARDATAKQAAAGVLLLIGSGYAPHAPGRLLTWTLAFVVIARAIIAPTHAAESKTAEAA
jgi:hypothetical protein